MKIATLGPEGTFSHQAAIKHDKSAEIIFKPTIWDVFEAVEYDEVDEGIVPIENSISGTIGLAIGALYEFDLNITHEVIIPIGHNLASKGKLEDIKTLYIHPQTHNQCCKSIRKLLPKAKIIHTSSNGESAKIISQSSEKAFGAIISSQAAKLYKLKILKKAVQDNKDNMTKFFVISRKSSPQTSQDRTTISVTPQMDKPGLLYNVLGIFSKQDINLSKIESMPLKGKLGQYFFLIEFEGHKDDENIRIALEELEKNYLLRVHGSYKRKY